MQPGIFSARCTCNVLSDRPRHGSRALSWDVGARSRHERHSSARRSPLTCGRKGTARGPSPERWESASQRYTATSSRLLIHVNQLSNRPPSRAWMARPGRREIPLVRGGARLPCPERSAGPPLRPGALGCGVGRLGGARGPRGLSVGGGGSIGAIDIATAKRYVVNGTAWCRKGVVTWHRERARYSHLWSTRSC